VRHLCNAGAVMMRIYSIAFLLTRLAYVPAYAETRRVCSDGDLGLTRCENASVTVQYPDGHSVEYDEEQNAGFQRHPGQPEAPAYPRRD
jgi:hypothetical protein